MTGLLLAVVLLMWLAACVWVAQIAGRRFPKRWWGKAVQILIAVLLMPLPLIDEIVGGVQFDELCKVHNTIQVDRASAKDRTVYLLDQTSTRIGGLAVPVRLQNWTFVDATTREAVLAYVMLYAEGGKLIHAVKFSEGDEPMTFKSSCIPNKHIEQAQLFKDLSIKQVQRSTIDEGKKK